MLQFLSRAYPLKPLWTFFLLAFSLFVVRLLELHGPIVALLEGTERLPRSFPTEQALGRLLQVILLLLLERGVLDGRHDCRLLLLFAQQVLPELRRGPGEEHRVVSLVTVSCAWAFLYDNLGFFVHFFYLERLLVQHVREPPLLLACLRNFLADPPAVGASHLPEHLPGVWAQGTLHLVHEGVLR